MLHDNQNPTEAETANYRALWHADSQDLVARVQLPTTRCREVIAGGRYAEICFYCIQAIDVLEDRKLFIENLVPYDFRMAKALAGSNRDIGMKLFLDGALKRFIELAKSVGVIVRGTSIDG